MKVWKKVVAFFTAASALVLLLLMVRREEKHKRLMERAVELEKQTEPYADEVIVARNEAEAARMDAEASRYRHATTMIKLRTTDETLANRVAEYNRRRLQRMRDDDAA